MLAVNPRGWSGPFWGGPSGVLEEHEVLLLEHDGPWASAQPSPCSGSCPVGTPGGDRELPGLPCGSSTATATEHKQETSTKHHCLYVYLNWSSEKKFSCLSLSLYPSLSLSLLPLVPCPLLSAFSLTFPAPFYCSTWLWSYCTSTKKDDFILILNMVDLHIALGVLLCHIIKIKPYNYILTNPKIHF